MRDRRSATMTPQDSSLLNPDVVWEDTIRRRAYGLYLLHGMQDGHALDDWLQAEQEDEPMIGLIDDRESFHSFVSGS